MWRSMRSSMRCWSWMRPICACSAPEGTPPCSLSAFSSAVFDALGGDHLFLHHDQRRSCARILLSPSERCACNALPWLATVANLLVSLRRRFASRKRSIAAGEGGNATCVWHSVRHDARKLGWKRWWQGAKAWLYPAVKKRRKHSAASDKSSTDNLSVAAKEDSQTSSQAGSHSFTQGAAHHDGALRWAALGSCVTGDV